MTNEVRTFVENNSSPDPSNEPHGEGCLSLPDILDVIKFRMHMYIDLVLSLV